jgi:hypothetical protein
MAEERTVSGVLWINTAKRNRQKVSTIMNQIQIRQYYGFDPKVSEFIQSDLKLCIRIILPFSYT